MQDRFAYQITPPPGGEPARSAPPSSSRMVASYIADIELLLEEQRWEQALREAFDLPQIAAALSDPRMQASVERVQAWCEQWLTHADDATVPADSDISRIVQLVCERADRTSAANEAV